jgi:hypothetical protein
MKRLIPILFLLVNSVAHAEQWLCIPDHLVGFRFDATSDSWVVGEPNVEGLRWIIANPTDDKYEVRNFDSTKNIPDYGCKSGFNMAGYLYCQKRQNHTFIFNKFNNRYLRTSSSGYVNVLPDINDITDATSDFPNMEIGRCSLL